MGKSPSTKVMEIFSEAATADAALRGVFLESACGGDAELRAEVESLLATEQRLSGFLGSPTVDGSSGADPDAAAGHDAVAVERGRALAGRYSIVDRIGEGGFGVVYCARQVHPIRRDVALKIVKLG